LTNWTDQPIHVFGGSSDCSCTVLGDLPVRIPGNESRSVEIRVNLKGSPGIFTRRGAFLIDKCRLQTSRVHDDRTGCPDADRRPSERPRSLTICAELNDTQTGGISRCFKWTGSRVGS
jgi:hypothetical protein